MLHPVTPSGECPRNFVDKHPVFKVYNKNIRYMFTAIKETKLLLCGYVFNIRLLGAFAKLRKATISPSVRMEQLSAHSTDFNEIW
jgi:hypothetical protein